MKRWKKDESGEALISFALTMPLMFAFLFGVMELCLAYYSYELISDLAREGTRYAIVHGATCVTSTGGSCTATAGAVNSYVSGLGWPNVAGGVLAASTSYPDGDEAPGHRVMVKVTCTLPYRIPFLFSKPLALSSTSEMYILF